MSHPDETIEDVRLVRQLFDEIERGNLDQVKDIVNRGINLKREIFHKWAIHQASTYGHLDIVRYFVQDCQLDPTITSYCGISALHLACEFGFLGIIRYFVDECNVDAAMPGYDGRTALHVASEKGNLDTVRYLVLDRQVDATVTSNDGTTAFHLACRHGHLDSIRFFIQDCHYFLLYSHEEEWCSGPHCVI